jgi:microcystin-dependent protein
MPSHTHTPTVTDPGHIHTILDPSHNHDVATNIYTASSGVENLETFSGSGGVTGTELSTTGITINTASTGITATNANTGGDGAHQNLPPYVGVNFIIKFTT